MTPCPEPPPPVGFWAGFWPGMGGAFVLVLTISVIKQSNGSLELLLPAIIGNSPGWIVYLLLLPMGGVVGGFLSWQYACLGPMAVGMAGLLAPFVVGNAIESYQGGVTRRRRVNRNDS